MAGWDQGGDIFMDELDEFGWSKEAFEVQKAGMVSGLNARLDRAIHITSRS